MKKYALLTQEGTACSETGICHTCKMLHGTDNIITPDDAVNRIFVDCTGNETVVCNHCLKP